MASPARALFADSSSGCSSSKALLIAAAASPSRGSLVMREVFSTLVTQEALSAEIRALEQNHDETLRLSERTRCSDAAKLDQLRREMRHELHVLLSTRERERATWGARRRLGAVVAHAAAERLLRAFAVWQGFPAGAGAAREAASSRLRRELWACEHALQAQRRQASALHSECAHLRAVACELSRRLELEVRHSHALLEASSNASKRASCATKELLASRHELVRLTAELAYGNDSSSGAI